MSCDHQDYLTDPEPLTPPERAWAQVNERYKALLADLQALRDIWMAENLTSAEYALRLETVLNQHRAPR